MVARCIATISNSSAWLYSFVAWRAKGARFMNTDGLVVKPPSPVAQPRTRALPAHERNQEVCAGNSTRLPGLVRVALLAQIVRGHGPLEHLVALSEPIFLHVVLLRGCRPALHVGLVHVVRVGIPLVVAPVPCAARRRPASICVRERKEAGSIAPACASELRPAPRGVHEHEARTAQSLLARALHSVRQRVRVHVLLKLAQTFLDGVHFALQRSLHLRVLDAVVCASERRLQPCDCVGLGQAAPLVLAGGVTHCGPRPPARGGRSEGPRGAHLRR